jgi:hypothetical protein
MLRASVHDRHSRVWAQVSAWIDDYNARRWHSALGMMSLVGYAWGA